MLPFFMTTIAEPAKQKEIQEKYKFMNQKRNQYSTAAVKEKRGDPFCNSVEKPITVTKSTASLIFPSMVKYDSMSASEDTRYWLSDKTRGQRYELMLFRWSDPNSPLSIEEECSPRKSHKKRSEEGGCAAVLINEKFNAHSISVMCNPALFDGTLLDGEMVYQNDIIAKYDTSLAILPFSVYLVFDIVRLAGVPLGHLPFSQRWRIRSTFLMAPENFLCEGIDPDSKEKRIIWRDFEKNDKYNLVESKGMLFSNESDVVICCKNQFIRLEDALKLSSDDLYNFLQPKAYPTEPWGSAVLTPERRHVEGEYAGLPTFKFKNCHTFDFEIVVPKNFPNERPIVLCQDDSRRIEAYIKTPSSRLTMTCQRYGNTYEDEEDERGWPVFVESYTYDLLKPGTKMIWECELAKSESTRCYYAIPKMPRPDKGRPNARFTINKTMETVEDHKDLAWLLERCSTYYGYTSY